MVVFATFVIGGLALGALTGNNLIAFFAFLLAVASARLVEIALHASAAGA